MKTPLDRAIDTLGGVGKLASAIKVSQSVVSNWRARKTLIDPIYCTAIEKATHASVTRQMLRPDDWKDIWPELADPLVIVTEDYVGPNRRQPATNGRKVKKAR